MRLEDILDEWDKDHAMDLTSLERESARVPVLHNKYGRILAVERRRLRELQMQRRRLRLEKYEFLVNPTHDKFKRGWRVPSTPGRILKSEVQTYLDGDEDVLSLDRKIALAEEKVEQLKAILTHVNQRSFILRDIIEERKYVAGL